MKAQLIIKHLNRQIFWCEMYKKSVDVVNEYKSSLKSEYNSKFPFAIKSESWYNHQINEAFKLISFCQKRYSEAFFNYNKII